MKDREIIARAICDADKTAPDPDAAILIGMRSAKAWEGRLPLADAVLAALADAGRSIEYLPSVQPSERHRRRMSEIHAMVEAAGKESE